MDYDWNREERNSKDKIKEKWNRKDILFGIIEMRRERSEKKSSPLVWINRRVKINELHKNNFILIKKYFYSVLILNINLFIISKL